MGRLNLKQELEARLERVREQLADLEKLKDEEAELVRLLATYEPEDQKKTCSSACPGCDTCRRGEFYR